LVSGYGCSDFRFRPMFPSGVLPEVEGAMWNLKSGEWGPWVEAG
jgi:hypothetical protein